MQSLEAFEAQVKKENTPLEEAKKSKVLVGQSEPIVLAFAQKKAKELEDWAKRSLESEKLLGASEPRF